MTATPENINLIYATIGAVIIVGGLCVTLGKLISAVNRASAALEKIGDTQIQHETKLAVHDSLHTSHRENFVHIWGKVNRLSDSGNFEPVKKR